MSTLGSQASLSYYVLINILIIQFNNKTLIKAF